MNMIQQKLLAIARFEDLDKMRRVDLQKKVGCEYPSQISHHKNQLIKKGKLVRKNGRLIPSIYSSEGLVKIPIMGEADCGEATKFADGRVEGDLAVSPSLLKIKNTSRMYALIARGDSMNRAKIAGKEICDSDYVIVEKQDGYMPNNGEIIVSNIGGLANVKKFCRDDENERILLLPDSYRQHDFAPIIISVDDDFYLEGKVIDVIKGVGE